MRSFRYIHRSYPSTDQFSFYHISNKDYTLIARCTQTWQQFPQRIYFQNSDIHYCQYFQLHIFFLAFSLQIQVVISHSNEYVYAYHSVTCRCILGAMNSPLNPIRSNIAFVFWGIDEEIKRSYHASMIHRVYSVLGLVHGTLTIYSNGFTHELCFLDIKIYGYKASM